MLGVTWPVATCRGVERLFSERSWPDMPENHLCFYFKYVPVTTSKPAKQPKQAKQAK